VTPDRGNRHGTRVAAGAPEPRVSFGAYPAEALNVARRRFDIALCGWLL
jgi:hypothetical protein